MAKATRKKKRLGKGLQSLLSKPVSVTLPESPAEQGSIRSTATVQKEHGPAIPEIAFTPKEELYEAGLVYLRVEQITPNPRQPRQVFDDEGLSALADSIGSAGLMQPIVVRTSDKAGMFELVAGERRWRAATLAGLERLPSIVREIDDKTSAQWALIENLQREDLNPIDRAEAFDRLVVDFNATQKEIAEQIGIDRSSVANILRLNDLESFAKDAVRDGRLTMGHAKVLLGIPEASASKAIARRCATEQWSVRELERQLKKQNGKKNKAEPEQDPFEMYMENLSNQLEEHLGTQVSISLGKKKGSGKLSISFYSNEQFEGILQVFNFKPKT